MQNVAQAGCLFFSSCNLGILDGLALTFTLRIFVFNDKALSRTILGVCGPKTTAGIGSERRSKSTRLYYECVVLNTIIKYNKGVI